MNRTSLIVAAFVIVASGAYWYQTDQQTAVALAQQRPTTTGALVDITVPAALSANAEIGKKAYDAKCAECHGADAVGQNGVAPPLVHKIYEPNHHGDEAFQRAAALGVQSHHWRFGDMPPVKGITRAEVQMIVTYIRELQAANGIN
jgi:mono/diheme cytochrome c family protein